MHFYIHTQTVELTGLKHWNNRDCIVLGAPFGCVSFFGNGFLHAMLTLPPLAACAVLLTCGIVKTDQHRTELNRLADCCWYLIQLLESTLDCCPLSIIMDWCISSGNSLAQTNDSHSNVSTKSWKTCDMLGLPCRVCSRPHFCFCFFNPFYFKDY